MRTTTADPTLGWVRAGALSLGFVALLWLSEIIDSVQGGSLDQYGTRSQAPSG